MFPFFADAGNLEAITPPWLRFEVVTPRPIEMRPGALIEYPLGPLGALAHRVLVRRDVERIFDFRAQAVPALVS